jgi:hypothetical protein
MEVENERILAFVKYEGNLVNEGYLDARKSGEALIGVDELVRYFIYQENPQIRGFEFDLPVRIRKGSWETIFPDNIDKYVAGTFVLWMAGKYVGSAFQEIAKNDFKDISFKKIVGKALRGAIGVIKLAKHLGTLSKQKFENISFEEGNELVKITNEKGEELSIPVDVLELYSNCPQTLFDKLTKIVEEERELSIGVDEDGASFKETISAKHKAIFSKPEEPEETVLPDLKHGEYVEIKGHITIGNEKSNTIGFLYEGHIITCWPDRGNIKEYKNHLFNNCLLKGYVDRVDKDGQVKEKRPRIRFLEIVNLDKPSLKLF